MPRLLWRTRRKAAQPPGTVEFVGERKAERTRITVFDFADGHLEERELGSWEECFAYRETPRVSWINIDGLHDAEGLQKLGTHFGLHPLVLEDIVNTHQRPKVEDHQDYLYIVLKMLEYPAGGEEVVAEQVSVVLGRNFVISFQEESGDVWDPVRERIRKGGGRLRTSGADYLAYALVDAVVDEYFAVLEKIGEQIETLSEDVSEEPSPAALDRIHQFKREMIFLRKAIWPAREVAVSLARADSGLIRKPTLVYLRDVHDHAVQLIDAMESYRDLITGAQDVYLSSVSNKTNEIMRILTVFAVIFAPLTLLAGVYGMNFKYMPELDWRLGYPLFWLVSLGITLLMINIFRRKGWF